MESCGCKAMLRQRKGRCKIHLRLSWRPHAGAPGTSNHCIPEYNADGFIAAIDRLAADSELLLKMGRESQAVVREKYTPGMTLSAFRQWVEG